MDVAILFARYGPYHVARLRGTIAAAGDLSWNVHGLEMMHLDRHYAWRPVEFEDGLPVMTVLKNASPSSTPRPSRRLLFRALDELDPGCVAVPGYRDGPALTALAWCRTKGRVAVLMSESKRNDAWRWVPVEVLKRLLIRLYDAALVGGRAQERYLTELGMGAKRVFVGYDVVDNEHFERQSDAARANKEIWRERLGVPRPFILSSSRFFRRKNIPRLIEAYAAYRSAIGPEQPWELVVLGDGKGRDSITRIIRNLGLQNHVHLPGFRQIDELPAWYGLANLFVHVPLREQWGLVVNEAMASALPVVVSSRAGASELVRDGVDGWVLNPGSTDAIAETLVRAHKAGWNVLRSMGLSAREAVRGWGPERFGRGLVAAAEAGLHRTAQRHGGSRLAGQLLSLLLTFPHRRLC